MRFASLPNLLLAATVALTAGCDLLDGLLGGEEPEDPLPYQ